MSFHTGIIKRGIGRAGKLGFPSINIPLEDKNISGIYAARVVIDGIPYNSAAYVNKRRNLLEAHLLDFSGELYGHEVGIELCGKIREDEIFENDSELLSAIADDIRRAREYFSCSQA